MAAAPASSAVLATIPPTVPELPNAYLVRDSDIAALKQTLLSTDGTASSTSLTRHVAPENLMNLAAKPRDEFKLSDVGVPFHLTPSSLPTRRT